MFNLFFQFLSKHKHFSVALALFLVAEVIVNPIGNFPLNDDWTYGKSVLIFINEGNIVIVDFAAMSLLSHILWGSLFTKLFWFSFSILRFSTVLSSIIGILFFYKLILRITELKNVAFFSALILLFNPLYFNLTNTFMTDINFNTVLILSSYFAYDFFQTQNKSSFFAVFLLSIVLVLIRQFGIIVPVCFTGAMLFIKDKRWQYVSYSFILTLIVYALFIYYEHYLKKHLGNDSAYKFSSNTHITSALFWEIFRYNVLIRHKQILLHVFVYSSPFALIYFKQILKKTKIGVSVLVIAMSGYLVYYVLKDVSFPVGNIFSNMNIGAETFFETLYPELKSPFEHTYSSDFAMIADWVKYILSTITVAFLILLGNHGIKTKQNPLKAKPEFLFLLALFFTYTFMILITESYFDRYHIPLITIFVMLLAFQTDKKHVSFFGTSSILICMMYLSVFGTKDYMELNRKRWEAYSYLKETKKIDPGKINGGFEINCWNEGKRSWWYDFLSLHNYDYLIQYRKEPDFTVYKEFEFQRYFPYKKDKIYIFVRTDKK